MTTYATVEDALLVARDNMNASKELARRGPGYVMVAEVVPAGGGYELKAVIVVPELDWNTTPNRHIVKRIDGRTCPVCGSQMTDERVLIKPGTGSGGIVGGLDPVNCVGCHDTMTTHAITPLYWAEDGAIGEAIPRPE